MIVPLSEWYDNIDYSNWEFTEVDPRLPIEKQLLYEALEEALDSLFEREKQVIYCRFYEFLTQKETGKRLNVSAGRILQIEAKALRKLRCPKRSKKLRIMIANLTLEEWNTRTRLERKREAKEAKELAEQEAREYREHLKELERRRIEREKINREKYESEMKRWEKERERVNAKVLNGYVEEPPDFLEAAYHKDTKLYYIKCPEWTTLNIPRDVYRRWLDYLMRRKGWLV